MEIHNNGTLQPAEEGPVEFQMALAARKARWKYYLVTDLIDTDEKFQILDKNNELQFSDENRTNLTTHFDSSDDIAKELIQKYPGLQIFRFVSDDLIFCSQTARKQMELHFNGNRLFEALPNPSLRNYSKIMFESGTNLHEQDAFFQIVKYLTKPFP